MSAIILNFNKITFTYIALILHSLYLETSKSYFFSSQVIIHFFSVQIVFSHIWNTTGVVSNSISHGMYDKSNTRQITPNNSCNTHLETPAKLRGKKNLSYDFQSYFQRVKRLSLREIQTDGESVNHSWLSMSGHVGRLKESLPRDTARGCPASPSYPSLSIPF